MATETRATLEWELLDAAELAEAAGRKTGTLDSIVEGNHFAGKLRARAERVREMDDEAMKYASDLSAALGIPLGSERFHQIAGCLLEFHGALCGPLPAATPGRAGR